MEIIHVDYPTPTHIMTVRDKSVISDLIIHHTAGSLTQTPLDIDAEHRSIGDSMIAYNYVITPDGKVYDGRPVGYVPAAAYGRNLQSLNVVLVGNFQPGSVGYTGNPTDAQYSSLVDLSVFIHQHFPSISTTIGHRDVATKYFPGENEGDYSTACPGDNLYSLLPKLRAAITATFSTR